MAVGTLVDSNVLLDILTEDPVWEDCSTGAHAAVTGMDLLTRHTGRHRTHFPTVTLIAPES